MKTLRLLAVLLAQTNGFNLKEVHLSPKKSPFILNRPRIAQLSTLRSSILDDEQTTVKSNLNFDGDDGEDPVEKINRAASAVGAALVFGSIAAYAPAWTSFFSEVKGMYDTMAADPALGGDMSEFWAALNFWTFFAAMHPLLTPVLWISEVLHACPGPKVAGLVPVSFIALNGAFIWGLANVKAFQSVVNAGLLAGFIGTVGSGLASQGDMSGYNLALNGEKPGIVRGCPTYDQVRQPSMADFDVAKYQGKWYENAFHDWTQFTEVYDTTLAIELSPDKQKWLDDFGLKGPSSLPNPRSWDKSPVANGAHYFLYGKLDPKNPNSGVLQETGFGVSFPNYIVDVKKSPNGEMYDEAIQFQCLERGGVRVFEGINFLSRSPTLTDAQLASMHERAAKAGMDPFGSSPEQMHVVEHTDPATWTPVSNEWQDFWEGIGLPKLLALVESATHSQFEDIGTDRVQ